MAQDGRIDVVVGREVILTTWQDLYLKVLRREREKYVRNYLKKMRKKVMLQCHDERKEVD